MTLERHLDKLAEDWLRAQHNDDWYIGDATPFEWKLAYELAHIAYDAVSKER